MKDDVFAEMMAQLKTPAKMRISKISRLIPFIKKSKKQIFIMFLFMTALTILSIPGPLIMRLCIDSLSAGTIYLQPFLLNILAISGLYLFRFILSLFLQFLATSNAENILVDIKQNVFNAIIKSNVSFLNQKKVGYITKRLDEIDGIKVFFSTVILKQLVSFLEFFVALFILFKMSWQLSMVAICLLPLFYFVVKKSSLGMCNSVKNLMEKSAEVSGNITDAISGSEAIKNIRGESTVSNQIENHLKEYKKKAIVQSIFSSAFLEITILLSSISTLLLFFVSGIFIMNGTMTIGTYFAVTAYFARLLVPIQGAASLGITLIPAFTALERLEDFFSLKYENEIFDPENHITSIGNILFVNVNFRYNENKKILTDLDFSITGNDRLLILGGNGSGKTTIGRLLLDHALPESGEILINDKPYRNYSLASLREKIGIANQQLYLFNETLQYNIAFSHQASSKQKIDKLISKIGLQDYFAKAFPSGINIPVGENGIMLSGGGQKQIISILRMLFFDAEVFIFDEAFSHIDNKNRQLLINYFNTEKKLSKIIYLSPVENSFFEYTKVVRL